MADYTLVLLMTAQDDASAVVKQLGAQVGKTAGQVDDAGKKSETAGGKIKSLAGEAFNLQSALAGTAVVGAAKATYELAKLGAQSMRTEKAFAAISGGATAATENLDAMRRATRGAMSETEMMSQANRLMQMGLAENAGELESLTAMAVKLGTAMGRDAGGAMEDFALMLANQSIPRLDTFGISAGKVRAKMAELQAATKGLTREEAFMIAVQEEGTKAMERLGDTADDAALQFERVEAQLADTKVELAQKLTPAVAGFLDLMNRGIGEAMQWTDRWKQAVGGIAAGAMNMVGAKKAAIGLLDSWDLLEDKTEGVATSNADLRASLVEVDDQLRETSDTAAEAAGTMSNEMDIAMSKAQIQMLATSQGWADMMGQYTSYQEAKAQLTISSEEKIAEIEAEYAGRRFETVRASDEEIAAFQIETAAKETAALRAVENKKADEEKAAAQLRYDQMVAANQEKLATLQGYSVMTAGITREEADKRIAAVQEGQAAELAAMEEGWAKQLEEQKVHFAEMQVAYLENQLASEDMTVEQRAVAEEALQQLQLEFGLTTEDAIAMTEAQDVLRQSLAGMSEEDVPLWVEAMAKYQTATVDGTISAEELEGIMADLDDETQQRLLDIFPEAASVIEDVGGRMDVLRDAAAGAYATVTRLNDAMLLAARGAAPAGPAFGSTPGLQHGTPFWQGGMAVVGENGAEVVRLPQGAAVYPNYSQTTQSVVNNTDNRSYSTTNNVSDGLAAAMILAQQRQQETAQLNALM